MHEKRFRNHYGYGIEEINLLKPNDLAEVLLSLVKAKIKLHEAVEITTRPMILEKEEIHHFIKEHCITQVDSIMSTELIEAK